MKNGIGFGKAAAIIDKSAVAGAAGSDIEQNLAIQQTTVTNYTSMGYMPWGDSNAMPTTMLKSLEGCGILNSIVKSQSRLALGEGVLWAYTRKDNTGKTIVEEIVDEAEISDFMEDNNHYMQEWAWMEDLIGFNHGAMRCVFNSEKKRKIVSFRRDDITELRYEPMNENGEIKKIFLCADWSRVSGVKDKLVIPVPLVDANQPVKSLQAYADAKVNQVAVTFKSPTWNKKYYPMGSWQPSQDWINIDMKIPRMKDQMFEHNFRPRYQVTIFEEFWQKRFDGDGNTTNWADYTDKEREDLRQKVYDDIDAHLAGVDNHGKAIYVGGWYDTATGKSYSEIEIKAIDDLIKEGEMLPESATATSEIAFGMKYNPAIIGASLPSGPYTNSQGGSNVRESVTVQILIHEPERQLICRNYNLIKRFNEWDKTYAKDKLRLEPIMPTTILTTLDTGGGTAPAIPGGKPGENNLPAQPNNQKA